MFEGNLRYGTKTGAHNEVKLLFILCMCDTTQRIQLTYGGCQGAGDGQGVTPGVVGVCDQGDAGDAADAGDIPLS